MNRLLKLRPHKKKIRITGTKSAKIENGGNQWKGLCLTVDGTG